MSDKEPKNCWEFWKCPSEAKEECSVFRKHLGRSCWYVPSGFRYAIKGDFKYCEDCPWYKKNKS